MLFTTTAITTALAIVAPFLASPLDRDNLGLRVRDMSGRGPLLVGEYVEQIAYRISLHNFSTANREYDPFDFAKKVGDLNISITQPDGKWLRSYAHPVEQKRPKNPPGLSAGESVSQEYRFKEFAQLRQPGRYRLEVTLKLDGKKHIAPSVGFDVVELPNDAILWSHRLPLEGREAGKPADEQQSAIVQQVKIGDRTWLIYRRFSGTKSGGGITMTARIAELSGKREMKVEGAYGDWNPFTITYREQTYSKLDTKLVINSIDGRPWTAEEEKHRQERLKKAGEPAPDKK